MSGTSLIWTPLGQKRPGVLITGVVMYTNRVFGTVKGVMFICRGRHLGVSLS